MEDFSRPEVVLTKKTLFAFGGSPTVTWLPNSDFPPHRTHPFPSSGELHRSGRFRWGGSPMGLARQVRRTQVIQTEGPIHRMAFAPTEENADCRNKKRFAGRLGSCQRTEALCHGSRIRRYRGGGLFLGYRYVAAAWKLGTSAPLA